MKKSIAFVFLLAFAGLSLYFFFAEDYCPLHCCPAPGGSFNHVHAAPGSVCLCFWSTLFVSGPYDFSHFVSIGRLPANLLDRTPLKAFDADIAHPPKTLPA
jgi:hypothetical protein